MKLFMQNEPNLCRFSAKNKDYDKKRTQNEPNTKPIKANLQNAKNQHNLIFYNQLHKKRAFPPKKNEPNTKPIKANLPNAKNQHNLIYNNQLHKKTPVSAKKNKPNFPSYFSCSSWCISFLSFHFTFSTLVFRFPF